MRSALARLFDPEVRVAAGDPRHDWAEVLPGEEAGLARATAARRREFRAGRALAREAMAALGLPARPIPAGPDRAPQWPPGVAGAISHSADLCIAAIARMDDGIVALGLDIEPAEPLDPGLVAEICTPGEAAWLAVRPQPGLLARAIFSAKECAYKAQYPLSGAVLGFHAMSVALDLSAGRFRARFEAAAGPFAAADEIEGRILIAGGHILTGLTLRAADLEDRRVVFSSNAAGDPE